MTTSPPLKINLTRRHFATHLIQTAGPLEESHMKIEEVLSSRTDLSTFLIHLTKGSGDISAKDILAKIIRDKKLLAGSPFGIAAKSLDRDTNETQRAVCFTETPMAHLSLLTEEIEGRAIQFEPYGIAITRKQGRKQAVNPVWYIDITPGHTWLTNPLNELVNKAIASGDFNRSEISKIAPFIEQMGAGQGNPGAGIRAYRKEFWWEREWRHVGDFCLPNTYIVLCPVADIPELRAVIAALDEESRPYVSFVDPAWSLESIIGKLAGFSGSELGPF